MRVIFYISALKDEVKVQEKKTQLELPSRQGKNPLPTQRRTQRSYPSRALGSRPPHASHAPPRIALRRFLLRPSEAAGAAEGRRQSAGPLQARIAK